MEYINKQKVPPNNYQCPKSLRKKLFDKWNDVFRYHDCSRKFGACKVLQGVTATVASDFLFFF